MIGQEKAGKVMILARHSANIVRGNEDEVNIKIRSKMGLKEPAALKSS
jgi:hypothetical protein